MSALTSDRDITFFAETNFRGERRRFGIRRADRRAHMYLVGRTGMGKSTLLETLIASDIDAANGFAVLDPHGDLAAKVRDYALAIRADDVIDFDPADHPIGYNPLCVSDPSRRYLAVSGIIAALRKIWSES